MPAYGSGDPADERFWRHVRRTDDCWLWTAAVVAGYGQFTCDERLPSGRKRAVKAHRFAWTLARGPIPAGLHVCHTCDQPLCVNVAHLFLGTHLDNMRDQVAKGRHPSFAGEWNPAARLTAAQAAAIRTEGGQGRPARVVAAAYGVRPSTVSDIWQGRTWRRAPHLKSA